MGLEQEWMKWLRLWNGPRRVVANDGWSGHKHFPERISTTKGEWTVFVIVNLHPTDFAGKEGSVRCR